MPSTAASGTMPGRLARLLVLTLVGTGTALAFTWRGGFDVDSVRSWIEDAGAAAPLLFMLAYAIGTVLFLPGSVLTLAGGALFGPLWGTFYNLTGATLGALIAFVIARYLAGDWVVGKTGGRAKQLADGVEREGWRFVAFTRLVPLFPFNLLNYALGLTRIPVTHYLVASYVFMLPGAFAFTWLGYTGAEAASGDGDTLQKIVIALSLLAAMGFLPRFVARLRQKPWLEIDELKQRVDRQQGLLLDVRNGGDFVGEQGHIRGALNIPLEELNSRLGELGDDPQSPIAIICRTDRRSDKAAALLARQGFSDARVVRGGMTAWLAQQWPVTGIADEPR